MRRAAVLMLLAPLLGLPAPSLARAEYTHASLVSYVGGEIAEDAYSPAISADGDYVAFAGTFNGVSGVWRKDPQTGELALVAGADESDPALSAPDAGSPSISESGQYVSFTTTARLDPVDDQPGDTGGCSSVYVRNMDVPAGQPGAYILASALNGTAQGISYAGGDKSGCPGGGSASADRVALSGNGQQVAFTVLGESDLSTGPGGAISTPAGQVAVRDLQTDTTTLVSQTMSSLGSTPEAVKGGAALAPADGDLTDNEGQQISGSTAAISADGSTVAWMGVDIGLQAPSSLAPSSGYDEPLWRRIGEGPDAPTRRVTGGDDPACGCEGPLDTRFSASQEEGAPVGGVFSSVHALGGGAGLSLDEVTPQLSANGQEVAFLSNKPRTGEVSGALEEEEQPPSANAYVVNMAPGLTRSQALTPLTEWASDKFSDAASTGAVTGIAISPDGTRVAFTTDRTEFPLTPPALVTPQLSQTEFAQLYVANLSAGTLEMASYGYDEEPSNGGILTPSFTGDGETLAYTSAATNLVYGAFNLGGSVSADGSAPGNVFTTSLVSSPAVAGQTSIGAAPAGPVPARSWELLLAAADGPNGSETVYVTVPGGGSLKALARAEVPIAAKTAKTKKAKKTSGAAKKTQTTGKGEAGKAKQAKAAKAKRPVAKKPAQAADPHETVATETVASASASPAGAGLVALRLTPPGKYRSLLEGHDGLYATIAVTFSAPGHAAIAGTLQLTFRYEPPKKKPGGKTVKNKTTAKKTSKAGSVGRS